MAVAAECRANPKSAIRQWRSESRRMLSWQKIWTEIDEIQYKNTYSLQVAMYNSFRVHIVDTLGRLDHLTNIVNSFHHFDEHWSLTSLCISDKTGGSFFSLQLDNVPFSMYGDTRNICNLSPLNMPSRGRIKGCESDRHAKASWQNSWLTFSQTISILGEKKRKWANVFMSFVNHF